MKEKLYEFMKKCCCPYQRYVIVFMIFWCLFNSYTQRTVYTIAIVAMTDQRTSFYRVSTVNQYTWSHRMQTQAMGSFLWLYPIMQIPGGYLANRFGSKKVLAIVGALVGCISVMLPVCIMYGEYVALLTLRIICGFLEGMTVPISLHLIAKWSPPKEMTTMSTMANSGLMIGIMFCYLFSGWFIEVTRNWHYVFYFYGALAMLWVFFWLILVFDDPMSHPYISDAERDYIMEQQAQSAIRARHGALPIKAILKSLPMWALVVSQCGHDYSFFIFSTMFPKFVHDVVHYDLTSNGLVSALPYLSMWIVANVVGKLTDLITTRTKVGVTFMRKFINGISCVGNAALMMTAFYIGKNETAIVVCFICAFAFRGFYYPSVKINMLDLAPNYTGVLAGIVNCIGAFMGIIGPTLTSFLIPNSTAEEWSVVFWITACLLLSTCVFYAIFGSGELQWWNEGSEGRPQETNQQREL